ncbi:hypothetical protein KA012_02205 [Candidatus Woesebacteria bacterium]|nr:hypothetical protein [Candidatus Woesebacteria bacterium]
MASQEPEHAPIIAVLADQNAPVVAATELEAEPQKVGAFLNEIIDLTNDDRVSQWFQQGGEPIELYYSVIDVDYQSFQNDTRSLYLGWKADKGFYLQLRGCGYHSSVYYLADGAFVGNTNVLGTDQPLTIADHPVSKLAANMTLQNLAIIVRRAVSVPPYHSLEPGERQKVDGLTTQLKEDWNFIEREMMEVIAAELGNWDTLSTTRVDDYFDLFKAPTLKERKLTLASARTRMAEIAARLGEAKGLSLNYFPKDLIKQIQGWVDESNRLLDDYEQKLQAEKHSMRPITNAFKRAWYGSAIGKRVSGLNR